MLRTWYPVWFQMVNIFCILFYVLESFANDSTVRIAVHCMHLSSKLTKNHRNWYKIRITIIFIKIVLNSSACNVQRFVLYSHLQKIQGHKREYKICLPSETIPDIMSWTWCNKKVTYFKIHPGNLYQYANKKYSNYNLCKLYPYIHSR